MNVSGYGSMLLTKRDGRRHALALSTEIVRDTTIPPVIDGFIDEGIEQSLTWVVVADSAQAAADGLALGIHTKHHELRLRLVAVVDHEATIGGHLYRCRAYFETPGTPWEWPADLADSNPTCGHHDTPLTWFPEAEGHGWRCPHCFPEFFPNHRPTPQQINHTVEQARTYFGPDSPAGRVDPDGAAIVARLLDIIDKLNAR